MTSAALFDVVTMVSLPSRTIAWSHNIIVPPELVVTKASQIFNFCFDGGINIRHLAACLQAIDFITKDLVIFTIQLKK